MSKHKPPGSRLQNVLRRPDLSEWQLDVLEEIADALSDKVAKAATEALEIMLNDQGTRVYLAGTWADEHGLGDGLETGEPRRAVDPLDVYIQLASDPDNDKQAVYKFNIREHINEVIGYCRDDGSFDTGLRRIMLALRSLADDIESALPIK